MAPKADKKRSESPALTKTTEMARSEKDAQSERGKKITKSTARVPVILSHVWTDFLSLAICGYIGGRFMMLRPTFAALPSSTWWAYSLGCALTTAFGGGTYYVFLMKSLCNASFGWQDLMCLLAATAGHKY